MASTTSTTPLSIAQKYREDVIAHLGITSAEFDRLPHNMVFGIATEMGMSAKDQAFLFLALTPAHSDTSSLKDYFAEQERRSLERWRVKLAKQKSVRQAQTSRPIGDLQDLFVDLVKNQALVIHDCLVLSVLLYGSEEDRLHLAATIMANPLNERERYTSTNLVRAELLYSSAFLQAHGDNLMVMPVPILPDKRLAAMNQQNLARTQEWAAPTGGVPTGGDDSDLFPCFAHKREVTGGGSLPIITRPDGQQALDTTELEGALAYISNQVRAMRNPPRRQFSNFNGNNSNSNNFNNNNNNFRRQSSANNNNNFNNRRPRGGEAPVESAPQTQGF